MDEALDASRMHRAGWDVSRIRAALDAQYGR
jgi:hypothetical protein